jgi:hypothetical protein
LTRGNPLPRFDATRLRARSRSMRRITVADTAKKWARCSQSTFVTSTISLRQFTNNAYNQHHGIQSEERFGLGVDADGDGFVNELTRADVTAVTLYQATLPVPVQVIPPDKDVASAIKNGGTRFVEIGCGRCHVPQLPLDKQGWIYTEPNPYNPVGNLQPGDAPTLSVDLTSSELPGPCLKPAGDVVWVPAFTDFKLHDISTGPQDPNREPLDMNQPRAGRRPSWATESSSPGVYGALRTSTLLGITGCTPRCERLCSRTMERRKTRMQPSRILSNYVRIR